MVQHIEMKNDFHMPMVFVSVHPISPTSLRSRGQVKFKYFYLPPPFETSFKDKTVTEPKRSKADNTLGTWWLFLMMVVGRTWVRIRTILKSYFVNILTN